MKKIRNKNGFLVNIICASCQCCLNNADGREDFRVCNLNGGHTVTKKTDVCNDWKPKKKYINILTSDTGRVKRIEYIRYVTAIRLKEHEDGVKVAKPISRIREEWEKENGSVYMC